MDKLILDGGFLFSFVFHFAKLLSVSVNFYTDVRHFIGKYLFWKEIKCFTSFAFARQIIFEAL